LTGSRVLRGCRKMVSERNAKVFCASAERAMGLRTRSALLALALTQEEFAGRYHTPLGTLRDWEQGRSEPDQPARAYLTVIAREPKGVARALHPVRS
jgi:putative transcriptional regulator